MRVHVKKRRKSSVHVKKKEKGKAVSTLKKRGKEVVVVFVVFKDEGKERKKGLEGPR